MHVTRLEKLLMTIYNFTGYNKGLLSAGQRGFRTVQFFNQTAVY